MTVVAVASVPTSFVPTPREPARRHVRSVPVATRPVAALRLSGGDFRAVAAGLRDAGFEVLDIRAYPVGPAPRVLVLELPLEESSRRRLLAASARVPGRILVGPGLDASDEQGLRPRRDVLVRPPFHALQVAAAALRLAEASEQDLAVWAGRAFSDVPPG